MISIIIDIQYDLIIISEKIFKYLGVLFSSFLVFRRPLIIKALNRKAYLEYLPTSVLWHHKVSDTVALMTSSKMRIQLMVNRMSGYLIQCLDLDGLFSIGALYH